jgi:hypothetical protein
MKVSNYYIKQQIYRLSQDALLFDEFGDNENVLKALFFIEFYKDLLKK